MSEVCFGLTGMDWNGRSWERLTKKVKLKKKLEENPKIEFVKKIVDHNNKNLSFPRPGTT
jgi:hypothetical protein